MRAGYNQSLIFNGSIVMSLCLYHPN